MAKKKKTKKGIKSVKISKSKTVPKKKAKSKPVKKKPIQRKPIKKSVKKPVKRASSSSRAKFVQAIYMSEDQIASFLQHLVKITDGTFDRTLFQDFLYDFVPLADRGKPIDFSEFFFHIDHEDPITTKKLSVRVDRIKMQ